jgi:hypothetical protein
VSVILVKLELDLDVSSNFSKNPKYEIVQKSIYWELRCAIWTYGQKERKKEKRETAYVTSGFL